MALGKWKPLVVILVVVSPLAAFWAWSWWDVERTERFCGDIRPGTPLSSLPALAEQHGINPRMVKGGVPDDSGKDWILAVPASTTMGDDGCFIHYDNQTKTVTSTQVWHD
jgi:hypothetical protein